MPVLTMDVPEPLVGDEHCPKCSRSPHQAWCVAGAQEVVDRKKEKEGKA